MRPNDLYSAAHGGLFRPPRRAFTLVELLFVVAVIGLLISLLLPAIQQAREVGRRHSCANNLYQLVLATHNYAAAHRVLPPGTIEASGPIRSRPVGYHIGWVARILPFIEQSTVYDQIDFSVGAYHPKNAAMRRCYLAVLRCPTNRSWGYSYAGCHHDVEGAIDVDNHGVLFLNSLVGWRDVPDGRAQTIFLGERLDSGFELGWLSGTRSTLRNTGTPINGTSAPGGLLATVADLGVVGWRQVAAPKPVPLPDYASRPIWSFRGDDSLDDESLPEHEYQPPPLPDGTPGALVVGGFESQHVGGAQFAFGDGSVRYLSQEIDAVTYQRMGHRADGELIDDRF
jgi:prepilin-type N-terminal cleavage/methylation domain-containing protein/prepilin-type processing-associated H-X9-DG protein